MTVLINRFNILKQRIEQYTNRNRIKRRVRESATEFGFFALRQLILNSPDGSRWTDPPDVFDKRRTFARLRDARPSLRQHGITLEQGWQQPRVDFRGSTRSTVNASMTITNIAPQAEWVTEGVSGGYVIPRNPSLDTKLWFFNFRNNKKMAPNLVSRTRDIAPSSALLSTLERLNNAGDELFDEQFGEDIFSPLDGLNE